MAFINTVAPDDATGPTREMYERQQASYGYVPSYAKVFSHRPEVMVLCILAAPRLFQEMRCHPDK
jgi:hypothetical protein